MHLCILHASIHASHTCVGAHIPQCACGGQRQLLWGFVSCPSLVTHDVLAFEVVRFGDSSFTLFMVVITVTVTYLLLCACECVLDTGGGDATASVWKPEDGSVELCLFHGYVQRGPGSPGLLSIRLGQPLPSVFTKCVLPPRSAYCLSVR